MNRVCPIRDRKKIKVLKLLLETRGDYRDLLLFTLGINTGLYISDILSMKWALFLTDTGRLKKTGSKIAIKERKTKKMKIFILNKPIYRALNLYFNHLESLSKDDYVFASQKLENGRIRPITRQYAWFLLNKYAKMVGIHQKIGTHTLRKTFGYHLYKKGVPLYKIQEALNQVSPSATLRYIGVAEELDEYDTTYISPNL